MRKNKFLAALAIAACLATSVPFSVNAATPGQAKDASKVTYGTVSTANQAIIQKLFDATYYAKENPDLAKAGITTEAALFNHFVKFGIFEGRACCEGFNVAAYKSSYSDLQAAFGDDIVAYYVHYVTFGQTEKRALVTVEAATAAGVTVKSAADGTVVAAGAAKPAAGGAASSGSAASTENKTEEGKNDSNPSGNASFKLNVLGFEVVNSVKSGAEEATFINGSDYDPATGEFYDARTKIKGEAYGVNVEGKYYKASNNHVYKLVDMNTRLKENIVRVDDNTFYNEEEALQGKAVYDAYTVGSESSHFVKLGDYYYLKAEDYAEYKEYKDVSGNAEWDKTKGDHGWRIKKNAAGTKNLWVWYDGTGKKDAKFYLAAPTDGTYSTSNTYFTRLGDDGLYYTTYHAALGNGNGTEDDHDFSAFEGGKGLEEAKADTFDSEAWSVDALNYFTFTPDSGYKLVNNNGVVEGHRIAKNIEEACQYNADYFTPKMNGTNVEYYVWSTPYTKKQADEFKYANDGYVRGIKDDTTGRNDTDNWYVKVSQKDALLANTVVPGKVYYDFNRINVWAYGDQDTDWRYGAGWSNYEHLVYDSKAIKDNENGAYIATAPGTPDDCVFIASDMAFYKKVFIKGDVFNCPAGFKIVQLKSNGRFYKVKVN